MRAYPAILAAFIAGATLASHTASPQTARTTKLVVPFPPGGSADLLSRVLADQIGRTQGQSIIGQSILVENRPGGGASIGYAAIAHAAPDGTTIGLVSNSVVINPLLRQVNYDPLSSFEPICNLVRSPQVIVVNGNAPYRTLGDLLAEARAKPGTLSFATLGPATTQHIAFEQLARLAKVEFIYVPYPGGAPATNALLGEHVTAVLQNYSEAVEHLNSAKLRVLAVASAGRIEPLSGVPTVAESGYPGYAAEAWFGFVAPAKTPKETVDQFSTLLKSAIESPDVKAKLTQFQLFPRVACGPAFAEHIRKAHDDYAKIIQEAKITAE